MASKPLYKIRNWSEVFEVAQTRKQPREMSWVPMPTRMDGKRYRKIAQREDGASVLGCWMAMVEIAAKRPSSRRGYLEDSDGPMGPEDLAFASGIQKEAFENAIKVLCEKGIEWLIEESLPLDSQSSGSALESFGLQNRTEQDRTEQNKRGRAASPPPAPLTAEDWRGPDREALAHAIVRDCLPKHWFPSDISLSRSFVMRDIATAANPVAFDAAIRANHVLWTERVNQAHQSGSLPRSMANKPFEYWIKDGLYLQEPKFGATRLEQVAARGGVGRTVARLLASGGGE